MGFLGFWDLCFRLGGMACMIGFAHFAGLLFLIILTDFDCIYKLFRLFCFGF